MQVQVQQVLARQGSRATPERHKAHIRGGNCHGAERRRARRQAMPATVAAAASTDAAPMLSEDNDGDGGAAPGKQPWEGRSEAPGQRPRVGVMRPSGPPPGAPASARSSARVAPTGSSVWDAGGGGFAADRSSTTDDWAELLSP